jgi:hypothetical protein
MPPGANGPASAKTRLAHLSAMRNDFGAWPRPIAHKLAEAAFALDPPSLPG